MVYSKNPSQFDYELQTWIDTFTERSFDQFLWEDSIAKEGFNPQWIVVCKLILWTPYFGGEAGQSITLDISVPNKTDIKEAVADTTIYTDPLYECGNN